MLLPTDVPFEQISLRPLPGLYHFSICLYLKASLTSPVFLFAALEKTRFESHQNPTKPETPLDTSPFLDRLEHL